MTKPRDKDCADEICEFCDEPACKPGTGTCYESSCRHEGHVHKGVCQKCGAAGLESDDETYSKEAPR